MHLYKRSNGFYYLKFKSQTGDWKNISAKTKVKKEALQFLLNFKNEITETSKIGNISFQKFIDRYQQYSKVHHSPSNTTRISYVVEHIKSLLNPLLISDITVEKIEYYKTVRLKKIKATTLNIELRALKSMFGTALKWNLIETNPFNSINFVKVADKVPAYITEDEFNSLLKLQCPKWLKDIISIGFYTGMRRNEILNLKWSDVNLKERYLIVRNTDGFSTKSKKDRVVPLSSKAFFVLSGISADAVFVFVTNTKRQHYSNYVTQSFKDLVRRSEIEKPICFHSLRHSCASNLVRKGASLYNVMKLLGHQNYSTTQIYAHLERDSLSETIRLLD